MKPIIIRIALLLVLCVGAYGKGSSPEEEVDALVKQLMSEKRGTAFQDFFAGSLAAQQKPIEIRAMDAQAKAAWEFYGPPVSYEILHRTEIGKSLFRIQWLTKNKDEVPLFWNALFYLRHGAWESLLIYFYDDPVKAGI